eukprot:225897-Pelagomonas_calceolata.AAC.1
MEKDLQARAWSRQLLPSPLNILLTAFFGSFSLIKFRHLSEDQSRQLKPKANGPWSRKYTSSGSQQFE